VLDKGSLDWQKLEDRGLGERLGAPTVLIYGTGKEIVARDRGAYPEKFGRWRYFLNRIVVGSFGIQAESGSVELRSDRCSGLVLFDQSCRMDRLKLLARQGRKWKLKFVVNKITRAINRSATNCLTQSNVQVL
jgi:hypothetical protein